MVLVRKEGWVCSVDECGNTEYFAKDLCNSHYQELRRTGGIGIIGMAHGLKGREITQELARELLSYDPETGILRWLRRPTGRISIGDIAGRKQRKDGYLDFKLCGKSVLAHRVAWLWMLGLWPGKELDHINGVRSDNRWINLREASRITNLQNQRAPHADGRSGFLGVAVTMTGKFHASITVYGKKIGLGTFDTAEEAHEVYLAEKRRLHEGCTI